PDLVGEFGQLDALELALAVDVEQAELDLAGMGGEQREIDADAVPGGAERERVPLAHTRRRPDLERPDTRLPPWCFCHAAIRRPSVRRSASLRSTAPAVLGGRRR